MCFYDAALWLNFNVQTMKYVAMDHVPTCMYLMSEPNKQIKINK